MEKLALVAKRVIPGAVLLRSWTLRGGVSARVEALELRLPDGATRRVVLRCPQPSSWKQPSQGVADEYALFVALHDAGIPVPKPLVLDAEGSLVGHPFLAMEFVEGTAEVSLNESSTIAARAIEQMAALLARLHALDVKQFELTPREDPVAGALEYLPGSQARLRATASLPPTRSPKPTFGTLRRPT